MKDIKGTLLAFDMLLVQKQRVDIKDSEDYYYNLGITDGENLMVCTSGKIADEAEPFKKYNLGFDYINKKLKLVDIVPAGKE